MIVSGRLTLAGGDFSLALAVPWWLQYLSFLDNWKIRYPSSRSIFSCTSAAAATSSAPKSLKKNDTSPCFCHARAKKDEYDCMLRTVMMCGDSFGGWRSKKLFVFLVPVHNSKKTHVNQNKTPRTRTAVFSFLFGSIVPQVSVLVHRVDPPPKKKRK